MRRPTALDATLPHLRRLWLSACLALLPWIAPPAARADDDAALLKGSRDALERGDIETAEQALRLLSEPGRAAPEAVAQRALVAFHLGDYAQAAADLEQAIAGAPRSARLPEWRAMLGWIEAARDATAPLTRASSEDGRYVVLYQAGADDVLVPYALEALQGADRAIREHLRIELPAPIRLEIFASARTLASVSSLTVEHIETTGTVALCKWNRLMVSSPRSLAYGYPWLDTIQHELVHLALSRASNNEAPVWFHEGLAKLFERTWRGVPPRAYLSPAASARLVTAAHDGTLIPFDKMHPSIAMLPSQEDAALAFAQVVTFLEKVVIDHGSDALVAAIAAMAQGRDARRALSDVLSRPFGELEEGWRGGLTQRPRPRQDHPEELKLRLVGRDGEADDSVDVPEARARKHLRLGDLLWGRGLKLAATREYERAVRFAPRDPILASRLSRGALAHGEARRALGPLEAALADHPSHAPLHVLEGSALLAVGRKADALSAFEEAIRLNPFDPTPHCELAKHSADAGQRAREEHSCSLLGGPPT